MRIIGNYISGKKKRNKGKRGGGKILPLSGNWGRNVAKSDPRRDIKFVNGVDTARFLGPTVALIQKANSKKYPYPDPMPSYPTHLNLNLIWVYDLPLTLKIKYFESSEFIWMMMMMSMAVLSWPQSAVSARASPQDSAGQMCVKVDYTWTPLVRVWAVDYTVSKPRLIS